MPAIRDFTSNLNATSTTTIIMNMPTLATNDLLLAIFSVSTAQVGAWTATGWTQLFSTNNSGTTVAPNLGVMYKISAGNEVATTFTHTTAGTVSGVIISVQDVNTTSPFGSTATFSSVAQAAASKFVMPSITTTVANSLVLYASSIVIAAVPSIIEGPVTLLTGQDGTTESLGVGWGFQSTVGATSTIVTCSVIATAAGVKAAIQIAAPAAGATIIPAYCSSDLSKYVNPINGITAYNTDGAFAATATTNFGTTLNGKTLANGTVAALTDYGVNSYHSVGQLTGSATSGTWTGANLLPATANKPDVTGKNVLVHVGPTTPKQLQTTDSVTLTGTMGIAFGMGSATTAYKWWHVHGANTAFGTARVPVIINTLNTTGLIQTTGTLTTTSIAAFGFATSGSVVAPVWTFASLWVLDTCVVVGGNASFPIDIPGIVRAYATGHERLSAIQQGNGQALLLGPVQLGNGGTNPTYLNLDSTAIEFPAQYNKTNKQVYYCSADNVAGISYFAGATDTIIHTNAVISSTSKYFWTINAGSSTSASYNFDGLQLIGAGTVTLKAGITFAGITFNKCSAIDSVGAAVNGGTIFSATTGAYALLLSSVANAALVTNCAFSKNAVGIRITTAGTYTFSGHTFSANTVDIDNASGGAVIINATNGCNVSTFSNSVGGGTVVINNSKTLTITGIVTGSEVRIYSRNGDGSNNLELAGIENTAGTTFVYNYNYVAATAVNIVVFNTAYQYYSVNNYTLAATDASLPVQQIADRQYFNPA